MPFGETRTISGTTSITETDFTYTGQRDYSGDFGLMDYKARFYSPTLGRFTQPDSLVPLGNNPQAWNRFSYNFNNPILFSDPTGNYPLIPAPLPDPLIIFVIGAIATLMGVIPDYRGLNTATRNVPTHGDIEGVPASVVASAVSVQSQWYNPLYDSKEGLFCEMEIVCNSQSSGLGIAQISDEQMAEYGLEGQNQEIPDVAVTAMALKIKRILDACQGCSNEDMVIASALAQNTDITPLMMEDAPRNEDGSVNWGKFFRNNFKDSVPISISPKTRQWVTGMQYNSEFMIYLFTNDMEELLANGYEAPWGLNGNDLAAIRKKYVNPRPYYIFLRKMMNKWP